MIRFQADEDFHHGIVLAVRKTEPAIDFASSRNSNLEGLPDPEVLELAAHDGRIVVTHDRRTMMKHFRDRLEQGKSSPGLLVASQSAPIGAIVEAVVMVWAASDAAEWRDQIRHLPSLTRHVFTH